MAELEGIDPDALLNNPVFDLPGTPLDLPVPPVADPSEEIVVHRTIDLPVELDARLHAAAAARGMSFEAFLRSWVERAA